MATTVQISEETKRLLDLIKKDTKKTFDSIIKDMAQKQVQIPQSMAGSLKGKIAPWNKEEDRLHMKSRLDKLDKLR